MTAAAVRLAPVRDAGLRVVHLLSPKGGVLCGTEPLRRWSPVKCPTEVCNTCHALACQTKGGFIAWEPKKKQG